MTGPVGRYYDADAMAPVREALEAEIMDWEGVEGRTMFGCPAYRVGEELFCFLVTDGLVLTALEPDDRLAVDDELDAGPFEAGQRSLERWRRVPVEGPDDLEPVRGFVEASYEAAETAAD